LCSVLQHSTAYGYVENGAAFEVTVPANVSEGFVAYGTSSYGYADFDNLLIEDELATITSHFAATDLHFSSRQ